MSVMAVGPVQVDRFRLVVLTHAMSIYLTTNGRMQATRMASPARMRDMATEYTGKVYPRSRRGLEMAYADLCALK